ncbi:protein arginine methyltransferase NDUFAF7, mitochondrial isoform X2 [Daktulosphaira vitifoliae]|uniref:protein arginine methyltransferase NDUFAF7, mitochondrial isoform X2 n=1 Tax=Daktulosphaira vitifoliae TaxID=58002 RepID=UPI0021A9DA4F|nr:protein arginine methyltransferase NDUFAF7, mitochondrial isoform X2 [Daktulosphaira vitifoliae]
MFRNMLYVKKMLHSRQVSRIFSNKYTQFFVPSKMITKFFQDKIKINGPITVADYMRESLKTYYNDGNAFGFSGDFITSPEISQLYGEMVMLWFINMWEMAGRPTPVNLIELGPGTGVMMTDMLRLLNQTHYKNLIDLTIHMVEISNKYSLKQAKKLSCSHLETNMSHKYFQYGKTSNVYGSKDIFWYYNLDDVPKNTFSFIVAQEFFDALPVHKFRKCKNKWREILIDIKNISSGTFQYVLCQTPTAASNLLTTIDFYNQSKFSEGSDIEVGFESSIILDKLCKRLVTDGGIFLCIDYGKSEPIVDSLRVLNVLNNKLLSTAKSERETSSLIFGYNQLMKMGNLFNVIGMVPSTLGPYLNHSIYGFQ